MVNLTREPGLEYATASIQVNALCPSAPGGSDRQKWCRRRAAAHLTPLAAIMAQLPRCYVLVPPGEVEMDDAAILATT